MKYEAILEIVTKESMQAQVGIPFNDLKDKHLGESVFILGNGPSLDHSNGLFTDMKHVISMNRSWRKLEQPRYHCMVRNNNYLQEMVQNKWNWRACDAIFYLGNFNLAEMFRGMDKEVADDCERRINCGNFSFVTITENTNFDFNSGHKVTNCGVFSIYVAHWLGFRKVYLLGYDCGKSEGHFDCNEEFGRWSKANDLINERDLDTAHWNKIFGPDIDSAIKASGEKFEIYNLNPDSRVRHFPFKSLEEALEEQ